MVNIEIKFMQYNWYTLSNLSLDLVILNFSDDILYGHV